jgi:simple sugar transport system ATP-binding protein
LILDKPTTVLTPQEIKELFVVLNQLKAEGRLIILISRKLKEVLVLSDRIFVIFDGRLTEASKFRKNLSQLGLLMTSSLSMTNNQCSS